MANKNNEIVQYVAENYHLVLKNYLIRKVESKEIAEELLQDLYIRLLKYEDLKDINAVKQFSFRVAKNLVIDRGRRNTTMLEKNSRSLNSCDPLYTERDNTDPVFNLEIRQIVREVNLRLDKLSFKCKTVFYLNKVKGLNYETIAFEFGLSVSSIEKYIIQANSVLKKVKSKYKSYL